MASYTLKITRKAVKALKKIHPVHRERINEAIDELVEDPRPPGVRKLSGTDQTWRIRIGDYRVIYDLYDDELVVLVLRVAHRKDAY